MMKKIKENKLLLLIFLLLFTTILSTIGRFVYDETKKNYFLTQDFYFNSDKLKEVQANYTINNYNGVDTYDIVVNVDSIKNNLVKSTDDIAYDITYNCTSNADCSSSKSSGIIYSTTGTDFFTISATPNTALINGQYIEIEIFAESTNPYEKEISAKFKLIVGNYGLSYEIYDEVDSPYLQLKVTNTLDYYKVLVAFGSYNIGDKLDLETYLALTPSEKENCASAIINLSFSPLDILYDNVSDISESITSISTTVIGGNDYVNALSFKIDAISSMIVRFYKIDASEDYTYPIVNPTPIVTVTYTL